MGKRYIFERIASRRDNEFNAIYAVIDTATKLQPELCRTRRDHAELICTALNEHTARAAINALPQQGATDAA